MTDPAPTEDKPEEEEKPTRLGKFIQTYSAFLSTFVIGIAGLIATSIWQYKQAEIARRQAESQQKVAETAAANSWRIERADILSKNLSILSTRGAGTLEQRYGVLLSLTRGSIIDPELAVSYALELGKENTEYMKSVLSSTAQKDYTQLAHAFVLTCVQRFGVTRDVDLCRGDHYSDRSDTLAQLVSDEMDAANASNLPGPITLLKDERGVQSMPTKLAWLFEPYLQDLYDRRQWADIVRFEKFSTGARLVAALVLATARNGEFVPAAEATELNKFHAERRRWLAQYLFGPICDGECKGKLIDAMLSSYGEAQGDYDEALRTLIERPRNEAGPSVSRVHARLLWCQMDPDDEALFRDHVLVPAVSESAGQPKLDGGMLDDLAGLVALVPVPTEAGALAAWKAALGKLQKVNAERYQKAYVQRRNTAERERRDPPPAMKNVSFCGAAVALTPGAPQKPESP